MAAVKETGYQPRDRELLACLTLYYCRYLGPRTWQGLVRAYGSPAAALDAGYEQWLVDSLATRRQVRSLKDGSAEEKARKNAELIADKGYKTAIWSDTRYPQLLRHIPDPPLLLYYRGNIDLVAGTCLAVVGSRKSSTYGVDMAQRICSELSKNGLTIVSGFAAGIDREAHLAGLDGPGSSIAVLGTGIDLIYPARNRDLWARLVKDGLVLTEFPPGTEPEGCNFPHRNRIIAGMCKGVLVVQAEIKSGSLITATLALDQGREVFAVPGGVDMPGYQGCNQLIRDGAWLVRDAGDILEVLGMDMPPGSHGSLPGKSMPEPNPDLNEEEIAVMDLLSRDKALHIDSITRETGWDSAMVSRVLTEMEIKGLIRRAPGMYFSRSV